MSIKRLEINGVRCLCSARLEDCRRINILSGQNGSGKTSILEAIYLLGMGRSFRSSHLAPIINHQMSACTVYGELVPLKSVNSTRSLGVRRTRHGRQEFHIDKEQASGAAGLARALPLQLINAEALELVEGGPKARRQFMDWGVFHVKPDFLETWRNFQRCLRQRNRLLREHKTHQRDRIYPPEIAAWDREFVRFSIEIDALRKEYVADIQPVFIEVSQHFTRLPSLSLHYQRGWGDGVELQSVLEEGFERDLAMGTTMSGPHRANVDIRTDRQLAADVLSRGQIKLVVAALKLAQGKLLTAQQGRHCVYLVDDLSAELDQEHQSLLCELFDKLGAQVFITGVETDAINGYWQDTQAVQQFHVKQGVIEQTDTN